MKEYQEDGKIIIKFLKSEENEADIFTKNTTNTIFQNHQKKLVWDKGKVNKEESQELTQNEIQQEKCSNLNQIRTDRQTDRQTVGLRFSWESVLTHICLSPWHSERDNYGQEITRK